MTYKFKKALLRNPSKSISSAISSRGLKPNFAKVVDEQNSYIDALINSGLKVHILDAIEEFPDSIFIEDPAIVYENYCVLLRPGTMSRFGESKALESEVKKYFDQVYLVKEGKIDARPLNKIMELMAQDAPGNDDVVIETLAEMDLVFFLLLQGF